jgi:uncharacterized coiled-coil DUF342 family protein
MENSIDLESLNTEFQFVGLGRQVRESVSPHPHIEVVRLQSAVSGLHRQLAGQNRELCQLAEANGRARADRDSQLEGLRTAIDKVAKTQQQEPQKVAGRQEVPPQIDGITTMLIEIEETVWRRVGPLDRAEAKDLASRVESEVADLRAMADGSSRIEEVRREAAGLKAELSDCRPKVNRDLTKLERQLAKVKEEMGAVRPHATMPATDIDLAAEHPRAVAREMRAPESEIGGLREAIGASRAKLMEDLVRIELQAKDGQRQSQEREPQAIADVERWPGGSVRSSRLESKKAVARCWREMQYGERTSIWGQRSAG